MAKKIRILMAVSTHSYGLFQPMQVIIIDDATAIHLINTYVAEFISDERDSKIDVRVTQAKRSTTR